MAVYRLQLLDVVGKNSLKNLSLRKNFPIFPNGLVPGNVIESDDAEPVLQHTVLQHFLLEIPVCLAVETLSDDALEHKDWIHRSAADRAQLRSRLAAALDTVGINGFEDVRSVGFKRKQLVETQQLACAFFGSFQKQISGKKIQLGGRLAVYSAHNGFFRWFEAQNRF